MLLSKVLDFILAVVEWFVDLFDFLPALSLPASLAVGVPVPLMGSTLASSLGAWFIASVAVALALVAGKALQWLYSLIPFKMT